MPSLFFVTSDTHVAGRLNYNFFMHEHEPKTPPTPKYEGDSQRITYRLVHVVYVVTLVATSIATFGPTGLLPGIGVCVFWAVVFTSRSRMSAFGWALLTVMAIACVGILFQPASGAAREAARTMSCTNNIKLIALALHNYHDVYGSFPPAHVTDEDGVPMHSWRVLILPYIEMQSLYTKYRFDEPWNGPNNIKLLDDMPPCYQCPSSDINRNEASRFTSYVAVVGNDVARNTWSSLLTMDDRDDLTGNGLPESCVKKRIRFGNCLRFGLFIALVLFPLPGVFREAH